MGIKLDSYEDTKSNSFKLSQFLNKDIGSFSKPFSNKFKESFYEEIAVLLLSGVPLKSTLELIATMQKKEVIKKATLNIKDDIVKGQSFSNALKKLNAFSKYEIRAINIGEQTGTLAIVTEDLSRYFKRKNELSKQLISSLSYPIIVLLLAVLVVLFMLFYVVPMFSDIFSQNNVELPWLTKQIVNLSNVFRFFGIYIFFISVILFFVYKHLAKKEWFYKIIGSAKIKIPFIGRYIRKVYMVQFTQAMALLTKSKIPIVLAIDLIKKMIHFYPLEKSLEKIHEELIEGEKLYKCFSRHSLYDIKMVTLLKVAEETNKTEFVFDKLYNQYASELKHEGQLLLNVFNFLLTLVVGIVVGFILIAMYLPMFKLSSVVG